jgi:hypothetical protein
LLCCTCTGRGGKGSERRRRMIEAHRWRHARAEPHASGHTNGPAHPQDRSASALPHSSCCNSGCHCHGAPCRHCTPPAGRCPSGSGERSCRGKGARVRGGHLCRCGDARGQTGRARLGARQGEGPIWVAKCWGQAWMGRVIGRALEVLGPVPGEQLPPLWTPTRVSEYARDPGLCQVTPIPSTLM